MKLLRLAFTIAGISFFAALGASAQDTPLQAKVSSVAGTATARLPDGRSVQIKPGMVLPQGASITTGRNANVTVEFDTGLKAGIESTTTVAISTLTRSADGKRNVLLDLANGSVVSSLDPKMRDSNNYSVRTPKGVAAARGTVYTTTVAINGTEYTMVVTTQEGRVEMTFTAPDASTQTVSVNGGEVAYTNSQGSASGSAATILGDASVPAETKAAVTQSLTSALAVLQVIATQDAHAATALTEARQALSTTAQGQAIISNAETAAATLPQPQVQTPSVPSTPDTVLPTPDTYDPGIPVSPSNP